MRIFSPAFFLCGTDRQVLMNRNEGCVSFLWLYPLLSFVIYVMLWGKYICGFLLLQKCGLERQDKFWQIGMNAKILVLTIPQFCSFGSGLKHCRVMISFLWLMQVKEMIELLICVVFSVINYLLYAGKNSNVFLSRPKIGYSTISVVWWHLVRKMCHIQIISFYHMNLDYLVMVEILK